VLLSEREKRGGWDKDKRSMLKRGRGDGGPYREKRGALCDDGKAASFRGKVADGRKEGEIFSTLSGRSSSEGGGRVVV